MKYQCLFENKDCSCVNHISKSEIKLYCYTPLIFRNTKSVQHNTKINVRGTIVNQKGLENGEVHENTFLF